MQERQRSWSAVWDWTSCRVQASFHALSVSLSVSLECAAWTDIHGCKHWVHKKCNGFKRLKKDPDYRCTRCQGTTRPLDGRPQKEVQVRLDKLEMVASFCNLGDMLSATGGCELSTTTCVKTAWKKFKDLLPVLFHTTSLSKHVAVCTALVCGAQCSMPARLGHWQSRTSSVCSEMTGQWSQICNVRPQDIVTTRSNELLVRLGTEDLDLILKERRLRWYGYVLQWCNQNSLWHTGWWKAWAWKAQNDMEAADREGLQRVEALSYQPSW